MSFKSILLSAAVAAVALPGIAQAAPNVNLAGVEVPIGQLGQASGLVFVDLPVGALLDPTNPMTDFTQTRVYGQVETIRPAPAGPLSWVTGQNGVELTYDFSIDSVSGISLNGSEVEIEITGSVNYYVDGTTIFDPLDVTTATDGLLWLSASLITTETIGLNTLNGQIDASDLQFEAVGGAFLENFDTNAFGGADIVTFSLQTEGVSVPNADTIFQGITTTQFAAISEPATLGLLGLGLVGVGLVGRRRS